MDVNEVTLTSAINNASVLVSTYKEPQPFPLQSHPMMKASRISEKHLGGITCGPRLYATATAWHLQCLFGLIPCWLFTVHKALGRNFIIAISDSVPQNNARAPAKDSSNGIVFRIHSNVVLSVLFSILHSASTIVLVRKKTTPNE